MARHPTRTTAQEIDLTAEEATNRGRNFFAVANLTILATSLFHGLQIAPTWTAMLDDIALGALAALSIVWYWWNRNRFKRSLVPLFSLSLAVAAKLSAIWSSYSTLFLGGPDFPIVAFLVITGLVFTWQYRMQR